MQISGDKSFVMWQRRTIFFSAVAYMFFYLIRKNLSMAQPEMLEDGVITLASLGTITTVHGLLYGLSRFVNGFWADKVNARKLMFFGLLLSALCNLAFGSVSLTLLFGAFWIVNGITQGMGFPPCTKMLTHWIHPKELATKMSIWNTSHSFGAVLALGICSLLFYWNLSWRWCFFVPGALALAATTLVWFCLRETPTEAGVPEIEMPGTKRDEAEVETISGAERRRLVFGNRVIWLISIANFFVYVVRFGFLDWGPTFLKQYKGIEVSKGGLMMIGFELAAVVGTIFAGWITDKIFGGRGVRTCVFCMLMTAFFSFAFWMLPPNAPIVYGTLLMMGAGFFIYGPQALIGIVAANQATKEAAALATGFTGIWGYASSLVSGLGIALIVDKWGWGTALCTIALFAIIGMLLFFCAWNAAANGYSSKK